MSRFPSPLTWYQLTIGHLPGKSLDIVNDGEAHVKGKLQMAPTGHYTGQRWQFLPSAEGSFCLRTSFTGSDMFLVSDNLDPHLSRTTDSTDSKTTLTRWYLDAPSDGQTRNSQTFSIRADIPGQGMMYLCPEHDPSWFREQRLRLKRVDPQNAPLWQLSEIRPVHLLEYLVSPLVSPSTADGWTNIRFSAGSQNHGEVVMKTDDVENTSLALRRLEAEKVPLGWAYKFNEDRTELKYLDVHQLQWKACKIAASSGQSNRSTPMLEFQPWSLGKGSASDLTFFSYLDSLENNSTIIIDVSLGFENPKIIKNSTQFTPRSTSTSSLHFSKGPESYVNQAVLFSHNLEENGMSYVFCVKAGIDLFRAEDDPSQSFEETASTTWACYISGDKTIFSVNAQCLRRIGLEDEIATNFKWSPSGIDVKLQMDESVPIQQLEYLGHGKSAVVDTVLCSSRVLARRQMKTNQKLTLTVALRELQSMRKIQKHRHIVKIVGSFIQENTFGVLVHPAAEFDLSRALEQLSEPNQEFFQGRLNSNSLRKNLWTYFGCLSSGLAHIHANSVCHGDIKPRKILVTLDGPLYTDFGIARDFSENRQNIFNATRNMFEYRAPEVARTGEKGKSSDIFSLGCVFLDLLSVLTNFATYQEFRKRRQHGMDYSLHSNIESVSKCIDDILKHETKKAGISNNQLVQLLFLIRRMLDVSVPNRPSALNVWESVKSLSVATENSEGALQLCGSCCFEEPHILK